MRGIYYRVLTDITFTNYMDNKQLWDSVLVEMELAVSKASFHTWFKDTYIVKQEDGALYLNVPNAFVKEWLLNKYHGPILKHIRSKVPYIHSIEYMVSKDDGRPRDRERARHPRPRADRELLSPSEWENPGMRRSRKSLWI